MTSEVGGWAHGYRGFPEGCGRGLRGLEGDPGPSPA